MHQYVTLFHLSVKYAGGEILWNVAHNRIFSFFLYCTVAPSDICLISAVIRRPTQSNVRKWNCSWFFCWSWNVSSGRKSILLFFL